MREALQWDDVAEYVAAGNVVGIVLGETFEELVIEIAYGSQNADRVREASILLTCVGYAYLSISRHEHHTPGSGTVLEAYFRHESAEIDRFYRSELETALGPLLLQSEARTQPVRHLEIIGEINVTVLCERLSIEATFKEADIPLMEPRGE